MENIENKILREEAGRLEADRKKWITERKAYRDHFQKMIKRMRVLNKDNTVSTTEVMWNEEIKPKLNIQLDKNTQSTNTKGPKEKE